MTSERRPLMRPPGSAPLGSSLRSPFLLAVARLPARPTGWRHRPSGISPQYTSQVSHAVLRPEAGGLGNRRAVT